MNTKTMNTKTAQLIGMSLAAVILALCAAGCSRQESSTGVKALAAGAKTAGFLSSYDNLKPNPDFENTQSYVKQDDAKNIHKYFAVIIDPVQIYVSSDADVSKMPDRGRTALAAYFQEAITSAISSAFPVVTEPGPLVLRLRTALIGVDVGSETGAKGDGALERGINIGKVGVEMEMVDSITGEQIAAAIDRQNLGEGAVIESEHFTREAKFAAAQQAFDGWAGRLREFLNSAHELSKEDAARADASYHPYGEPSGTKKR
jgi:hypothetical protein